MKKSAKTSDDALSAFFVAVQQDEIGKVRSMLRKSPDILKCVNRDGFSALDVATMLNHREASLLLLRHGFQENCELSVSNRLERLNNLVDSAEQRLCDAAVQPTTSNKADEMLSQLESHLHTLKKMRNNVTTLTVPAQPRCFLHVGSATSLVVSFGQVNAPEPIATKYKVEWSVDAEFTDVQTIITVDLRQPCVTIFHLRSDIPYYVRVCAGNFKGFSEPVLTTPSHLAPSCWRDLKPQLFFRARSVETAAVLIDRVKKLEKDDFSYSSVQADGALEKRRKLSLKSLLLTDNRLHKGNKSGLYVASILYRGDKVLHTYEDQFPLVQIDSSGPTAIASQFQWFLKLCCAKSVPSVGCIGDAVSHCSTLTYRMKLIQAMRTLQTILGQDDLGMAHVRPIVDRNESAVFVTVKNVESSRSTPGFPFKWCPIEKLKKRLSVCVGKEETVDRVLLKSVEECVSYHRRSTIKLEDGLYVGYVKLESSLNEMRILSAESPSNVIPFVRVRRNAHISRDEWEWLHSLKEETAAPTSPSTGQMLFHWELLNAVNVLLRKRIRLKEEEIELVQAYLLEVVEITDTVSFIFLLPPDNIRFVPNMETEAENSDSRVCSVKILEIANLRLYHPEFMSNISYVSIYLDIHMSVLRWFLRQTLDDREENDLQRRLKQCVSLQEEVESLWKSSRWIGTVISGIRNDPKDYRMALSNLFKYFRQNEEAFQKILDDLPSDWINPSPEETAYTERIRTECDVDEPEQQSDSGCYSDHSVDRCSYNDIVHIPVLCKTTELAQKSDPVSTVLGQNVHRRHLFNRPSSLKDQSVEETLEVPFIPLQTSASETSFGVLGRPTATVAKATDVEPDNQSENPAPNDGSEDNSPPVRLAQSSTDVSRRETLNAAVSGQKHSASEGCLYEKSAMGESSGCALLGHCQSNGDSLGGENGVDDLARIDQLYLRRKNALSQKRTGSEPLQPKLCGTCPSTSEEKVKATAADGNLALAQTEVRSVKVHLAFPGVFPDVASVHLRITGSVTARDVIEQVIERYSNVLSLDTDKLEQLCLVVVLGARERCLRDDYPVLCLKYPWHKGKLLIRKRSDLLTALECGNEAEV
uniref:Fibronectin type-III domain-containing protein n=1 Tax=Trichuris muris TaxID=70415 RepID=A0A5S6QKK8_TRIMR